MKKYLSLIFFAFVLLGINSAQAKIRSITDWDGGQNPHQPESTSITGEQLETTCSKQCLGYSLTTASCPEGQKLIRCAAPGCAYYTNCIVLEPGEKSNTNATDKLLDDIDLDEIYEQIVKEQEAEKAQK